MVREADRGSSSVRPEHAFLPWFVCGIRALIFDSRRSLLVRFHVTSPMALVADSSNSNTPRNRYLTSPRLLRTRAKTSHGTVTTDRDKLQIVLSNLFDNAVEYTDRGGSIRIGWEVAGPQLTVTVANSGCDLDDELLKKVTVRFWRADTARSSTERHAGLGLALCLKIVELLRGSLEFEKLGDELVATLRLATER